ncbi:MAG: hypothetical protein HC848_09150 [Limnobacter sp.]|nr:hypothetical protein [Limnobacter sp.]
MPLWFLHLLGVLVGGLVYGFSPKMRRQMRQHFDALYPGQPLGRKHILRASALHSGMMLMELPFLWGRSRRKGVLACSTVVDWQVIEQAERQGKGIVFLTPHLGVL